MAEDKIIKTGQLTWPRIFFLLACGAILFVIVATGKVGLGYILLTAVLCVLLFLIMIDYKVDLGTVDLNASPAQPATINQPLENTDSTAPKEVRPRRRTSRPAKRRR